LLPRVGLPIRFYERRGYDGHTFEATLAGLRIRLEDDKRENLEQGFPTDAQFSVDGQPFKVDIYAFKKDGADKYRKNEGVIFTVNGQTHGHLTIDFFRRNNVGLSYIADSLLVVVECDGITGRAREDLFMNSRDRLRDGELRSAIERNLEQILRQHPGLRELKERRRREAIESKLADSRPLKDVLDEILKKSPALAAFLAGGKELSNPFKSRLVGETEEFIGKQFPTYFLIKRGDKSKECHLGSRFRVQFETDANNDYFSRDVAAGELKLHVNGQPTDTFTRHIWNGVVTLNVSLPADAKIADELHYKVQVIDPSRIEPFY